jgi:membrane associated rhomboid family serine protease
VTLVHGGEGSGYLIAFMHLGFNMYALYICGPVVEQIYGPLRMAAFYVIAALGASIATFALGESPLVVGASGAIFGFFGILFAASRLHLPMLDRRGRALVSQVGSLIVVNVIIGFTLGGMVDNIAHLGGLVTGLLLAVAIGPGQVPTLRSMWTPGTDRPLATRIIGGPIALVGGIAILVVLMAVGLSVGMGRWG